MHPGVGGEAHRDAIVVVVIGHGHEVLLVIDEPRRLTVTQALNDERQIQAQRSHALCGALPFARGTLLGDDSGLDASVPPDN